MKDPFLILGIESSCDETAAAIVRSDGTILSSEIASQMEVHAAHGGVVPEIAARAHLDAVDQLVAAASAPQMSVSGTLTRWPPPVGQG